jgi:hypothetical protein
MAKVNQAPLKTKPPKLNKNFSAPALLAQIRKDFGKIHDHRISVPKFSLPDVLMSGLAIFGLKYRSLLDFDQKRNKERVRANLRGLYGVIQAPCDTQLRTVLDEVSPADLCTPFISIHRQLLSQDILKEYQYLGGIFVSTDGTGQLSSFKVSCPKCCQKNHHNGETEYYHQLLVASIVHPDKAQVLPLFPEPITYQDGATKNDCESNASKRLLPKIRDAFPDQKIIILEDSLAGNGPHLKLLKKLDFSYIIGVQPGDHQSLFEAVKTRLCAGQVEEFEERGEDGILRGYRFVNEVPLNKTYPDILVNFLDYWEIRKDGKEYNFSWITDIQLVKTNVYLVMRGGRTRWKIENENINTLKNQSYHLEHNYGHGKKHLATIFVMLTLLAFLVDQVQELCCDLFKAARQECRSKISLWETIRGLFARFFVGCWKNLWLVIIYGSKGGVLQPDTS